MTTTYVSEYDPLNTATYDPTFTANISNRMQVPDSIHVGGMDNQSPLHHPNESPRVRMKVPERILLAGDDQHVGLREEFRNMDEELMQSLPNSHVGLTTPPRVLKIEDSLPNDDETPKRRMDNGDQRFVAERREAEPVRHERSFLNGLVSMDTSYRSMTPPLPLSAELMADESLMVGQEDEDVAVRRQLTRLQRHVIHLEEENDLRSRREMILYPTLLLYFLFQIGKWFVGRK